LDFFQLASFFSKSLMYKYHIYLGQFDFFNFFARQFQGDLKTAGYIALGDSEIYL